MHCAQVIEENYFGSGVDLDIVFGYPQISLVEGEKEASSFSQKSYQVAMPNFNSWTYPHDDWVEVNVTFNTQGFGVSFPQE